MIQKQSPPPMKKLLQWLAKVKNGGGWLMSSTDYNRKYSTPEDKENAVFSADNEKRHSYREAVHDDLETSTKHDVIRQQGHDVENPQQPIYTDERETSQSSPVYNKGGSRQPLNHQDSAAVEPQQGYHSGYGTTAHSGHRKEESRHPEETLDSVKFDGDIDLNREKKPEQLGFRNYGSSERYNHINDVERPTGQPETRYGTVEKESDDAHFMGGAAGVTAVAGTTGIFKIRDRSSFAESINGTVGDSIKTSLKASESDAFANKTWGKDSTNEKKGVFRTAAGIAGREIETAVGQKGSSGDIDDRAKGQAQKFGYKAGKYALLGGATVGCGTIRTARYGKKLSNDVAAGILTGSEAKKLLTGRLRGSLTGSGSALAGIIKTGTAHVIEDFQGSDDLGMQAITKPKDMIVGTARTFKVAKATGKTFSKGIKVTKSTAKKVQQGGKAVFTVGKKLLSNPVILKGIGIAALVGVVVAIVISVISATTGVIPALSLKNDDYELSQTYLYITELDARMQDDIVNEDKRLHIPSIDKYSYYVYGVEVPKNSVNVYTNADLILTYLDSRYEDYTFSSIIGGLFGTNVKGEVKAIHEKLHQVEKVRWTEEIEHESTSTDPDTGETSTDTWTEYVYHMDISLTTQSWQNYYETNKDTLLTKDQQEQYNSLKEVGTYTFRQELESPFVDKDWQMSITARWGWRIHPISGELKKHLGLDIAMAGGTPINACNSGKIEVGYDADGWGNYVKVIKSNGDYTLYGHMSSVSVSSDQQVKSGDIIGNVGTTGASTGNHLHLEYHKGGKNLNPLIFLGGEASTGAELSDGSLEALIAEAEKYIGYPYVWGGSTPSTSFDCSGYICWIFTQSGTYNLPRTTAQGIYNQCIPISQSTAQPGDLIFFTGTYSSPSPVSHIGLYVGNGRMIHCGNPIGYTSINTSYWQRHFYGYGRLR